MRKAYLIDQKVINIDSHNPNGQLAQASKECFAVATHVCRERQYNRYTLLRNQSCVLKQKANTSVCLATQYCTYNTVRTQYYGTYLLSSLLGRDNPSEIRGYKMILSGHNTQVTHNAKASTLPTHQYNTIVYQTSITLLVVIETQRASSDFRNPSMLSGAG